MSLVFSSIDEENGFKQQFNLLNNQLVFLLHSAYKRIDNSSASCDSKLSSKRLCIDIYEQALELAHESFKEKNYISKIVSHFSISVESLLE